MTLNNKVYDVIIIGAGYAGLSLSYHYQLLGISHVVLEKGNIGHSWSSQRWDSFKLNTPNWLNALPGLANYFEDSQAFVSASDFVAYLVYYAKSFNLPVITACEVVEVNQMAGSPFTVDCIQSGNSIIYTAHQIVVASGSQRKPKLPNFTQFIPQHILQIHVADYKKANNLPEGAVLVVGSGQSGTQIVEDLLDNGKKVHLATSKVGRLPRRYRGKDIEEWCVLMNTYEALTNSLSNHDVLSNRQPVISGTGNGGHTISLQYLMAKGAVLHGKISKVTEVEISFEDNLLTNLKFADQFSIDFKKMVDDYVEKFDLKAPVGEIDEADLNYNGHFLANIDKLDLNEQNISTIIWATGFGYDFSYLKFPIFDENGLLKNFTGANNVKGLSFLNLPLQRTMKSGIIYGIQDDAKALAEAFQRP